MFLAVFCVADIPTKTLEYFLERTEEYLKDAAKDYNVEQFTDETIFIISDKDASWIPECAGASRPFEEFESPFKGETIEQVASWFRENIRPMCDFYPHNFVILDAQSPVDNSCLLVCDDREGGYEEVQTLRCEFYLPCQTVAEYEYGNEHFDCGIRGMFRRSRLVMTGEAVELVECGLLKQVNGVLDLGTSTALLPWVLDEVIP